MNINLDSISHPQVRQFYLLYWPQHQILLDFYNSLPEECYDTRMVDAPGRQSDTPRQSLAHIIYVQMVYFEGLKTGKLEFKSLGTEHFAGLPKAQLLAEWERADTALHAYLTAEAFDSQARMQVFWGGEMNALDVLYFLRDHDILHVGWNLALMDHLGIPRYPSLISYWG